VRIAVVGKGGVGKSVIAGTLARELARTGHSVLALDSDLMPGLALSLGAEQPAEPPLIGAAEKDEEGRWRLKPGIGPARAVNRYSTPAPDGVRLLQCGKAGPEGLAPIMGAVNAYYKVIHRLDEVRSLRDWTLVGDLPAGPRQTAFDWAPFARTFLVVIEPTVQSALTARRVARIARMKPGRRTAYVANKVESASDVKRIAERLGQEPLVAIPLDPEVADAERRGLAPIEHAADGRAVAEVGRMVERLPQE
jgi:CO dehydrogenase maturation factor